MLALVKFILILILIKMNIARWNFITESLSNGIVQVAFNKEVKFILSFVLWAYLAQAFFWSYII